MPTCKFSHASYSTGQSLIEVLVALALFTLGVAAVGSLVFDSHTAVREDLERTQATLYAKEGMEAARTIRDSGFDNLTSGTHGIVITSGHWVFAGTSDTPEQFNRSIVVTDIDADTKKVESTVSWDFKSSRSESVSFSLALTRWRP